MIPDIQKALKEAVKAIYFDDSSDYGSALWNIVDALGGKEAIYLLEEHSEKAYDKYCSI